MAGRLPSVFCVRYSALYMYICILLRGIEGASGRGGGQCSRTALVPNTYVKMVFVPLCCTSVRFAKLPERNTWLSHLWLEHFYISLASDSCFGKIFINLRCALMHLYPLSIFIFYEKTLKLCSLSTEAQKNLKPLCFSGSIIFYMHVCLSGTHFWLHCPSKIVHLHLGYSVLRRKIALGIY
jgi:hypothetical protein